MGKYVIILLSLFLAKVVFSAEVDFTARTPNMRDLSDSVNGAINWRIGQAVMDYNDSPNRPNTCGSDSKELLSTFIATNMDTNLPEAINEMAQTIMRPPEYEERELVFTQTRDSIYKDMDFSLFQDQLMNEHGGCCYPNIKLRSNTQNKDVVVGLDKVDHFLSNGFAQYVAYSEASGNEAQKLNAALQLGVGNEDGAWGLKGTGMKSYGDLAANYGGMQMYQDLMDGRNGRQPLIRCERGRYTFATDAEIDIRNYVTEAWDEGTNCNSYNNNKNAKIVASAALARGANNVCPLSTSDCQALRRVYPTAVANSILNNVNNQGCVQRVGGSPVLRVESESGVLDSGLNGRETMNNMEGINQ